MNISADPVDREEASARFEDFYSAEYARVLALTSVLSGRRAAAEEVTQDAFLAAYRQWDRVAAMDAPGAWVRRVAANQAVSGYRRTLLEAKVYRMFGVGPDTTQLDVVVGEAIWREVRKLPRRQAQAVALTYLEGLSRREVAEILGCGEETVKTHLDRARATLAKALGEGVDDA